MKEDKNTKFPLKKHGIVLSCIAAPLLCLGIFAVWYLHPRTYSGDITVQAEDGETLSIHLELNAKRSFFKPEELGGSIFIDYNQYVSTFLVEERDDEYWESFEERGVSPSYSSYSGLREKSVSGNTGDWFLNLKAKLRGEKWVPFFVLRGQATIANIIEIDNIETIFEKDTPEECNLVVYKDGKIYTVK